MSAHNFNRNQEIEPNPSNTVAMSLSVAHSICVEFDNAENALAQAAEDSRIVAAQNASEQADLLNEGPVARQQARAMYVAAQAAVSDSKMRLRLAGFGIGEARRVTGPVYTMIGRSAIRATSSVQ